MKYSIIRTDKADNQLHDIIFYIADDSGSVTIASDYLTVIEHAIASLSDFPNAGAVPRYPTLERQGHWVLIVEKHLIFYKVNDNERMVTIYAIVDGRREYRNLI